MGRLGKGSGGLAVCVRCVAGGAARVMPPASSSILPLTRPCAIKASGNPARPSLSGPGGFEA